LNFPCCFSTSICSSGTEPLLLLLCPRCHSPSSIAAAQWLGLAVESQDLGTHPLSDGAVSVDGNAGGGGGGATRVGEGSGDGSVRGANGPWGRPLGPMVMHVVRWIAGAPTGLVATMMRCSSASSSLPSLPPECPMMRGLGPVQPSWGKPNRGRHTILPSVPMERRQGLRALSAGKPAVQWKETGPLQHTAVWHGRRRRLQWWCRGKDLTAVASSSTVTAEAAAWGSNRM
jgi:hypothetical protein